MEKEKFYNNSILHSSDGNLESFEKLLEQWIFGNNWILLKTHPILINERRVSDSDLYIIFLPFTIALGLALFNGLDL